MRLNRYCNHFLAMIIFGIVSFCFYCSKNNNSNPAAADDLGLNKVVYEQSGKIDAAGGTIQISDPSSPLVGSFVEIPENALPTKEEIRIEKASKDYSYNQDSTNFYVSFEPSGVEFAIPVTIGIPYNAKDDGVDDLTVYYFDEQRLVWKPLPQVDIDRKNHIIKAQVKHFTVFTADRDDVKFDIGLFKRGNQVLSRVRLSTSFEQIPAWGLGNPLFGDTETYLKDIFRIKEQIKGIHVLYDVVLNQQYDNWFDKNLSSKRIIYYIDEIYYPNSGYYYEIVSGNENRNLLYSSNLYLSDGGSDFENHANEIESQFRDGIVLFDFPDILLSNDKSYFIEVYLVATEKAVNCTKSPTLLWCYPTRQHGRHKIGEVIAKSFRAKRKLRAVFSSCSRRRRG